MHASELAAPFPTVRMDTPALDAARLLAGRDLPGLLVLDDDGRPAVILPGTEVLSLAIPAYCQDDPALARAVDEAAADVFLRGVADRTVAECLPEKHRPVPTVPPDATVLEVASVMAGTRIPLVAVSDHGRPYQGVVTLDALLDRLLGT
ncbi:histidine kinase [Actinocatenispora thailandica]|uniref:Histidine kinase n=1 Tax=Actinocatenispora thailandica TaxID=227318 RepID=A0A7R7DQ39_9ACTN|nr:CBS domain-containing protein [Actinocatenispora thailandica]BCJ35666.1 histidine kinase [Actinocatenispora thailandica]